MSKKSAKVPMSKFQEILTSSGQAETPGEITSFPDFNISYLGDNSTNPWKHSSHFILGTDPYPNNSISLSGGSQDNSEKLSKYVHLEHKDVEMKIPDFPKKNKKRNN